MIPKKTITTINGVRETFLDALRTLRDVPSFATLCQASPELGADLARIGEITKNRNVTTPCTGEMTCAIVGSSGHGKTTIRQWAVMTPPASSSSSLTS